MPPEVRSPMCWMRIGERGLTARGAESSPPPGSLAAPRASPNGLGAACQLARIVLTEQLETELNFFNDLGVELGQSRSREVLALYLKGLRLCSTRRTLTNIAAALCSDTKDAARLVDRFNYQLNDRRGRTGASWSSEMMKAMAGRVMSHLASNERRAFVLVAMYAPQLGAGHIRKADIAGGTAQMAAVLLAVGRGPTAELEAFPIGWRLAFDGWTPSAFDRAAVPKALRYADHVSVPAASMLAEVSGWGLPDLPIVASAPFAELRLHWLMAGWSYVVQWKKPHASATAAIAQSPGAPLGATLDEEIQHRREDYWRDVHTQTERTSRGPAIRTDLWTKWQTRETDVQVDGSAWCAHLPHASEDQVVSEILAYDALREAAKPVYGDKLRKLGLDDYRGPRFTGWQAHRTLVTAAHLLDREEAWRLRAGYRSDY